MQKFFPLFVNIVLLFILGYFIKIAMPEDKLEQILNSPDFLKSLAILILLISSLIFKKIQFLKLMKYLSIWLIIFIIIIIGYSYKSNFQDLGYRLIANIIPSLGASNKDGSMSFFANDRGHFQISALVNDKKIDFLVDTGATFVSLTKKDATKIGINIDSLQFNLPTNTANGQTFVAYVKIDSIKIGNITVKNVQGTVSHSLLDKSLLGMSFLSKLSNFTITNEVLTIK